MPRPVTRPGLAFVAWTRVAQFKKIGFRRLPPLEDFIAVRQQLDFKQRCAFEVRADALHDELLARRGVLEREHSVKHQKHFADGLWASHRRVPEDHEMQDLVEQERGCASR